MVTQFLTALATTTTTTTTTTTNPNFDKVTNPVVGLLNSVLPAVLAVVVALGTIYCVILGVKYAKAEEPQEREKAKHSLKNAIIGFALIFILILALNVLTPIMTQWVNNNAGQTVIQQNGTTK